MNRSIKITIAFIIIGLNLFGQIPKDPTTNKFTYEAVVNVDSLKSEDIYNNAREWVTRTLKSADNNISFDKESKSITTTGNLHLENRGGMCGHQDINLNFKFSVFAKDGRYKYIIENFYISYYLNCGQGIVPKSGAFEDLDIGKNQNEKVYKEADLKIIALISDLEKNLKLSSNSKKNDW